MSPSVLSLSFDESDEYPELLLLLLLLLSSSTSTGGAPPRVDFDFAAESFVRALVLLAPRALLRDDAEASTLAETVGECSCVDAIELLVIARLEASGQMEPVPIEAAIVRSSPRKATVFTLAATVAASRCRELLFSVVMKAARTKGGAIGPNSPVALRFCDPS
jgi:hypothetical protein